MQVLVLYFFRAQPEKAKESRAGKPAQKVSPTGCELVRASAAPHEPLRKLSGTLLRPVQLQGWEKAGRAREPARAIGSKAGSFSSLSRPLIARVGAFFSINFFETYKI